MTTQMEGVNSPSEIIKEVVEERVNDQGHRVKVKDDLSSFINFDVGYSTDPYETCN